MGLSQQVAFSSLLAFFPAVVFLVGLLDLVGAYETLQDFLAPVAPGDVLDTIEPPAAGHLDGRRPSLAFVVGAAGADLGGERRDERGDQGRQPRLRPRRDAARSGRRRLIAVVLVAADGARHRRPPAPDRLRRPARRGDRGPGASWAAPSSSSGRSLRWPIAFVAILLFFALVYYLAPNVERAQLEVADARLARRRALWLALSGLFALYTSFSDSYSKTYGALASGIVLLLWLNYSAFALLFGAELNAELDGRRRSARRAGRTRA